MKFSSVYPLYVEKAEKKNRTRAEEPAFVVIALLAFAGHQFLHRSDASVA